MNLREINKLFSSKLRRKGVKTANEEKLKNRLENPARSRGSQSRWAPTQAGSKAGARVGESVKEIFVHWKFMVQAQRVPGEKLVSPTGQY